MDHQPFNGENVAGDYSMEKLLMQPSSNQQQQQLTTPSSTQAFYTSLLGLAETFRTMTPPNIRLCLHCLKSILFYKLPSDVSARTHLQIGKVMLQHTKSDEQIRFHLDKARTLGSHLQHPNDVIKFEASELLAEYFESKGKRFEAACILNDAMRLSNNNPYWHCRLLLKIAHIHVCERDIVSGCEILAMGAEYAQLHRSDYTRGLFLLSKCMLLLASKQLNDVAPTLEIAGNLLENISCTPYQKEALRIFYLIVQVSHWLIVGQAKSARPTLKQLHQSIQQFAAMDEDLVTPNEIDMFQWLPREQMVVLIYLMTVMQSMQGGMMERAQRYTEKALTQIEKLAAFDTSPILSVFHLCLLEHSIMCRLVMGNKSSAVQDIGQVCRLCHANSRLMYKRAPQLHTLLGLYAMSMNCMDQAESQFKLALKLLAQQNSQRLLPGGDNQNQTLPPTSSSTNYKDPIYCVISLNLALVYIRQNQIEQCEVLLKEVCSDPSNVQSCFGLCAASCYVRGFQAFCEGKYSDAKSYLRDTLRYSNSEDLTKLTASALITLGQIFMNSDNAEEAKNMIEPAIQLANRMPDISVQLWATALLKDIFNLSGDQEKEKFWFDQHEHYSQSVIDDHMRALHHPEHVLIQNSEPELVELFPNLVLSLVYWKVLMGIVSGYSR